jgi:hypothetical protein
MNSSEPSARVIIEARVGEERLRYTVLSCPNLVSIVAAVA